MKDMMTHRGYYGSVCYNDEDRIFYGKVEFIRALVSYEGMDVVSLRKDFEEAVEDYLEMCGKRGIEPEKPLKGSFNVRIGPELHRRLALTAARKGLSLNKYIADLLKKSA
jgi:predicted HicB family RNase H-like nuclease